MMISLAALLVALPFTLSAQSKITIEGDSNLHQWSCTAKVGQSSVEIDKTSSLLVKALFLRIRVLAIVGAVVRDLERLGSERALFF